jgi:hypothetical protein
MVRSVWFNSFMWRVRSCDIIFEPPAMNPVPGIRRRCNTMTPMMVA